MKWKTSFILRVYKKGHRNLIGNYRPIEIINSLAKIFDLIICEKIADNLRKCIINQQHGSTLKKSVLTIFKLIRRIWYKHLQMIMICSIYTDFIKAFDKVNHDLLLFKLKKYGLGEDLFLFIESSIKNRTVYVIHKNVISNPFCPGSGIRHIDLTIY